jgi:DNA-binding NarL/FixJ family response regulator
MITIVLADDHPVVRAGLHALLGSIEGLSLVAQAEDGHAAVRAVHTHRPDVVIMDIDMPGLNGIEATRQIVAAVPETAVLMLTMYEDDDSVFTAMRAGARGYLLKGAGQDEIARAIRAVGAGEVIFAPGVAQRVLAYFAAPPRTPLPELTEREREILDLIARGRANGDIAARTGVTRKTVANHISNIFAKLQVADRTAAIAKARDAGLGKN